MSIKLSILVCLVVLVNSFHEKDFVSRISSIERYQVNGTHLTITSFLFNPTSEISSWIDRVFGNKSVYNSFNDTYKLKSSDPISTDEKVQMNKAITDKLILTNSERSPNCSMEILGFAHIDQQEPITANSKKMGPIIGSASYAIDHSYFNIEVKCYYRAVYETWKPEVDRSKPNYWAVLFYCPILNNSTCGMLNMYSKNNQNASLSMRVDMTLNDGVIWSNNFIANLRRPHLSPSENTIGVCVAIPYASSDKDKHIGNAAMLREWIKYYVSLNMKVFIYDRSGVNYDSIYNSGLNPKLFNSIVYYNYTMRGFLNPHLPYLLYDNNEQIAPTENTKLQTRTIGERFARQGVDKALTLTQCRFEAKINFGIENIIVVDFDEFLYCPKGNKNTSQIEKISEVISSLGNDGFEQIIFPQKVLANKTESVRDCIIEKAVKNESLFNCVSSSKFIVSSHSIKSIHLGLKCPLTGYHQACPIESLPRAYDCDCKSSKGGSNSECIFIHLSTKNDHYKKFHQLFQSSHINEIRESKCELLS